MSPRVLRGISPDATPEEVAAVVAAIAAAEQARVVAVAPEEPPGLSRWIYASRLTARRAGHQRGDWRLSGRIGRRARA